MEGFEELKAREALEELNEAKRLLYVAFTRAEEEVFWCVLDNGKIPKVSVVAVVRSGNRSAAR